MAYNSLGLTRIASTGTIVSITYGLFAYLTADAPAVVEGAGYFNAANELFTRLPGGTAKGDILLVVSTIGGTPTPRAYSVTNTGSVVALVPFTEPAG